jgi:hypothetical protein
VSPRLPENLSYTELKTELIAHFDQTKNKFAESIKFRQITQQDKETIAQYSLRLRQGAAHCDYGNFLDRMLVEQMLHGLQSREMCDEVIAKNPANFTTAYQIVQELEATHHTASTVKSPASTPALEQTNKLGYAAPQTRRDQNPFSSQARGLQRGTRGAHHRDMTHQGTQRAPQNVDLDENRRCNGCGGSHVRSQCFFY